MPMVLMIAAVVVARLVLLSTRPIDMYVTQILIGWLLAATFREPWVQSLLMDHTSLTLSEIRLATHGCVMAASVAVYLVVRSWRLRPVAPATIFGLYFLGLIAVAALALISAPARTDGVAVEELHSWRTAVYMIIYSAPMPIVLVLVMAATGRVLLHAQSPRRLKLWIGVIIAAATVSLLDHLSRMANGIALSLNWHNALIELRSQSNDVLFLPAACALAAVVAAPVFEEARVRLRSDPSSRAVVRLQEIWQDVIDAVPQVKLETDGALHSSLEREHRMLIECEDALFLVLPYMRPEALRDDATPEQRCRAISDALSLFRTSAPRQPIAPPKWMVDEDELLRTADAWSRA